MNSDTGHRLTPPQAESSFGFVVDYARALKKVLFEPAQFFRELPVSGGLGGPLAFALVTHWIGSLLNYFWSAVTPDMSGHLLKNLSTQFSSQFSQFDTGNIDSAGRMTDHWAQMVGAGQKVAGWLWGASSILLDPFFTLVSILFFSFFIFIGARLFVNPTPQTTGKFPQGVTYESALRVVAFGMSPAIFAGFPFLGTFIAKFIYIPIVTIIGARELYRVSNGRAVLIALFPEILFWGIIAIGAFVVVLFFLKFATSMFMST
jgi:hypothetical protein